MRQWVAIGGFFILVLILISGCTSTQSGATTGSNSQNSAFGNTNVTMTSAKYVFAPVDCNLPWGDPVRFQKYFPVVPGWERGQNFTINRAEDRPDRAPMTTIMNQYKIPGQYTHKWVFVIFIDAGPCVNKSSGFDALSSTVKESESMSVRDTFINNFHGYRAVRSITNGSSIVKEEVGIYINNRLAARIICEGVSDKYSISEADADIEKFANAIDFSGLATAV